MMRLEPCPVCRGEKGQHAGSCTPQARVDATIARAKEVQAEYPDLVETLVESRDSDDPKRSAAARWMLDILGGVMMPAGWSLHTDERLMRMPRRLVRDADGTTRTEEDREGWA